MTSLRTKNILLDTPPVLPVYAKSELPPVVQGGLIYVTDDVDGPTPAFSDGVNWLRVYDGAVIS